MDGNVGSRAVISMPPPGHPRSGLEVEFSHRIKPLSHGTDRLSKGLGLNSCGEKKGASSGYSL
jgi:hypothetical protein